MKTKNQSPNAAEGNGNSSTAETKVATPKVKDEKVVKEKKVKKPKPEKVNDGVERRGRKTDPTSARSIRLANFAAKKAAGLEVKRGRPTNPNKIVKEKKVKAEKPAKVEKPVVEKVAKTPATKAVKPAVDKTA